MKNIIELLDDPGMDPFLLVDLEKQHYEWLRHEKCFVCRQRPVDVHHVKTRGAGGRFWQTVPLCRIHHSSVHSQGVKTFQLRTGLDLMQAAGWYWTRSPAANELMGILEEIPEKNEKKTANPPG